MTELVKSDHATAVNSSLTSFDSATIGMACFYFLFVSRDMRGLLLFMSVMAAVSFVLCILVLPESPAWLIAVGRKKEAIKSLNIIAWFNSSKSRIPSNAVFEEETMYGNNEAENTQNHLNMSSLYLVQNLSRMSWIANRTKQMHNNTTRQLNSVSMSQKAGAEDDFHDDNQMSCRQLFVFVLVFSCIANCYWITLYNVPNLGGNKFFNGFILGVSEMSSGVVSGLLMQIFSRRLTFQLFILIAIVFSAIN